MGSVSKNKSWAALAIMFLVIAAVSVVLIYLFYNNSNFKSFFSGASNDIYGNVGVESQETIAKKNNLTTMISFWIFLLITILQFVTLWIGYAVFSAIDKNDDSVALKMKNLENAEIFLDVPLYVGLFGTVSAFLVMTFSPQSSRLIAYSSTLIGIIFSLILRLSFHFPLKRKLINADSDTGRN